MSILKDVLTRGNNQVDNVNNGSLLVANRDKEIASLKATIAEMQSEWDREANQAANLLAKQIDIIERFNLETVGSATDNESMDSEHLAELDLITLEEQGKDIDDLTDDEINQAVNPPDYSVQFSKAIQGVQSARITLGQYDLIYRFYIVHPTSGLTIELNGIPNKGQRHEIGGMLAPYFDNLKEGKNKNSLRTIRRIEDQSSTGKLLTCGRVWPLRNCKCNDETPEVIETELDGLLDDLPVEPSNNKDLDYLNSLVGETEDTNKVIEAVTKKDRFFSTHDPSKGTETAWRMACQAVRVSANKGIGHAGYLDRRYDAINKIALASDKITPEMLAKE